MDFIREQFEKIRDYFERRKSARNIENNQVEARRIVIRARNNPQPQPPPQVDSIPPVDEPVPQINPIANDIEINNPPNNAPPRIAIQRVNRRAPIVAASNIYGREMEIPSVNLGHGMTIKGLKKPVKCPICATRGGEIVENPGGRQRWKCMVCDSNF